ncbi:MAG: DUF3426 domain-containing protein [Pseudomonadales bacterium]|nr:DUF3426 domain-containing protein [Pseudomonadales bacterium]
MDDSLLTKCPHCKTLFRIQHDHLAIANGNVRCGVCYKVFNAKTEGLAYSEDPSTKTPPPSTSRKEAAEILNDLELPNAPDTTIKKAGPASTPDQEDIRQLVIAGEPIEQLFLAPKQQRFVRPWLWGSACLLATLLLITQWLWFNIETYSINPKWRPWYQTACRYLGCRITEYIAPSQIQTERLTVKTHADYSNVLVVDLIINNRAPLPQPMPAINLAFYDINGVTLSSRVLKPQEYLDKSISLKQMPRNTPIHLSFSIMDPGDNAVNYGVQLESNFPR